jgi:hypothetical protein
MGDIKSSFAQLSGLPEDLITTAIKAESLYIDGHFSDIKVRLRVVAEKSTKLIASKLGVPSQSQRVGRDGRAITLDKSLKDLLDDIRGKDRSAIPQEILDAIYKLKGSGNIGAHDESEMRTEEAAAHLIWAYRLLLWLRKYMYAGASALTEYALPQRASPGANANLGATVEDNRDAPPSGDADRMPDSITALVNVAIAEETTHGDESTARWNAVLTRSEDLKSTRGQVLALLGLATPCPLGQAGWTTRQVSPKGTRRDHNREAAQGGRFGTLLTSDVGNAFDGRYGLAA